MALVVNDRVKETSTTTGTGTLSLAGAVTGFETFVAGIGNSNTTYYSIVNENGEFEVGLGTVTDATPDTLARTTVISSSNSDSAVNFSAGTKDVFCTLPASKAVIKDASGNIVANNGSALTNLNASNLASGTVPDARFPATLPALNGSALTNLNASNVSGSGANLTTLTAAYPVGSIYMNATNSANPSSLLGFGTWVTLGAGKMPINNGGGFTAGDTGGSTTHTLSEAQLPEHKHFLFSNYSMDGNQFSDWARRFNVDTGNGKNDSAAVEYYQSSGSDDFKYSMAFDRNNAEPTVYKSGKVGSGSSVNHMNPYIVVYMWKRTA